MFIFQDNVKIHQAQTEREWLGRIIFTQELMAMHFWCYCVYKLLLLLLLLLLHTHTHTNILMCVTESSLVYLILQQEC